MIKQGFIALVGAMGLFLVISVIVLPPIIWADNKRCHAKYSDFERVEYDFFSGCRVYYKSRMWPVSRIWIERKDP